MLWRRHFNSSTTIYWRGFAAALFVSLAAFVVAFPVEASTITVGTMPGNLGVTPTGAATSTIPIALPRGAGGLTPSIALIYNSQSGSGAAGWGWTLSGLSAITRCPKTIADDGVTQAVQLQSTDDYCL
ncbi:MAG: SpvB/TcaC N-terminal domain-containing protein, partial [Candidatus Saccharimonadales bacterium]